MQNPIKHINTNQSHQRLTTEQVAKILGKAVSTLLLWRKQAIGPPFYKEVGRIYYIEEELAAWRDGNHIKTHR